MLIPLETSWKTRTLAKNLKDFKYVSVLHWNNPKTC